MKRTAVLLRGAKGYGWYDKYLKQGGQNGFRKNNPPTPFNWENPAVARPQATFQISAGNEDLGSITFELAEDIVPSTVSNFKKLCTGDNLKNFRYQGSKLHAVQKGVCIMGGDVENLDGTGNHAASERYIRDENFIIPHSARGLLRYSKSSGSCGYVL